MWYEPDSDFEEAGQNHKLLSDYSFSKSQMSKQLHTLRSFPGGDRNCYTLSPKQGRNNKYIVRAFIAYGSYDLNNRTPIFYLYLGVNRWKTIDFDNITSYYSVEVILVALRDIISVCLVNTGKSVPFISSLKLWLLGDYTYPISSLPLDLLTLSTPGRQGDDRFIRFEDDTYGRVSFKRFFGNLSITNTSVAIDLNGTQNSNKLPTQVLMTAIEPPSLVSSMEIYYDQQSDSSDEYFCYFYFFEFEQQATIQKRIMNISFNDKSIPHGASYYSTSEAVASSS